MGGKAAIAAGLIAGVAAGGIGLAVIVFVLPAQVPAAGPTPSAVASVVPPAGSPVSPSSSPASSGASGPPSPASPSAPSSGAPSASPSSAGGIPGAFGVGGAAPPLKVTALDGTTIDLGALRGKPVWVNFMATWCPSCVDEMPLMTSFATRYADTGLTVVAVDVREDPASVQAFTRGLGVTFPVAIDGDGSAQRAWRAYALPVHFWVDRDGIVRDGALGGIGPDIMIEGLRSILPGVDITS
jgi:thiol-disulfide isomerase/thioredoxin